MNTRPLRTRDEAVAQVACVRALTCSVLATALGGLAALSASADFWNGPTHYLHTRSGMPDFDQQRSKPPRCSLPPFPAIPTPGGPCAFFYSGGMHCGPACGVNLYVFMANHGYPALLPAAQLGDIWRKPEWFCQGTAHIGTLGAWSGWSFAGTSTYGMMVGLQRAVNNHRQPIVVKHYMALGTYGLNLNQLAETGRAGAVVMVAYGHYLVVGALPGGVPIVQRNGGHFVVMTGAYRNDPICKLRIRDPADDGCAPDLPTQSQYQHHVYNAVNLWVRVGGPGGPYRWMTRIFPETDPPAFGVGSTIKLLDGMVYAMPRRAIGRKLGEGVGPPAFFEIGPPDPWVPGGGGPVCAPIVPLMDAVLLDVVQHPDGRGLVLLVGMNGIAGEGGASRAVILSNPDIGKETTLAELEDAESLLVGRDRGIYALGQKLLHRIDLPDEAESPPPDRGEEDAPQDAPLSIELPFATSSFEYDDLNDLIVVVSADGSKVAFFDPGFRSEAEVFDIPARAAVGENATISANPKDGVIWLASADSSSLVGLERPERRRDSAEMVLVDQIGLPLSEGSVARDIDFLGDDELVVITSLDGTLHFRRGGEGEDAGWRQVLDDPFDLPCELDRVVIDRPRGNYDPAEHDDPGFNNLDPGDLIPGIAVPDPLCLGDLNDDFVVDGQDLGLLLGLWGPADVFIQPSDLNGDGQVDGADLGMLLGYWGPCPD